MKATRTMAMAVGAALLATGLFAAPSVEITSVQQQYPWTNTVDIVYTVAGVESETNGYFVVFTPTTSTGESILDVNGEKSVQVALKGSGVYSTQWFPQTNQQYTACKMTPSVFRGAAKDYLILDLDNWTYAYEPMATQEASNQRYQANEYKTRYLVLRRVEAGDYWIGGDVDYNNLKNTRHQVNMPRSYYFAIYEMSEAQWARIMNDSTSRTSVLPKGGLNWNIARGSALPAATPSSGVFKQLSTKMNLAGFDLPTAAMWEVAARAKLETAYQWGNTLADGLTSYAWVGSNSGSRRHEVGLKTPNLWGIYDLNGNQWEMTRDNVPSSDLATVHKGIDGQTPIATGNANLCIWKGGYYGDGTSEGLYRLSGGMSHVSKSVAHDSYGIRLSIILD